MFRHRPVPRDISVSRQISIVCCESVWNCQTPSKDGLSQLVNSITFRPFFFSLRPMSIVSYQFCPVPMCAHHVFCILFSCLSIDSSLYHVIFSHLDVFSVSFVKGKVEFVTLKANFDYSVTCLNRITMGPNILSCLDRIRITQTRLFMKNFCF